MSNPLKNRVGNIITINTFLIIYNVMKGRYAFSIFLALSGLILTIGFGSFYLILMEYRESEYTEYFQCYTDVPDQYYQQNIFNYVERFCDPIIISIENQPDTIMTHGEAVSEAVSEARHSEFLLILILTISFILELVLMIIFVIYFYRKHKQKKDKSL